MKRVKIEKYNKEKKKAAWKKYKAERAARKYGFWENVRYIISEAWKTDKLTVLAIFTGFSLIGAVVLQECFLINMLLTL